MSEMKRGDEPSLDAVEELASEYSEALSQAVTEWLAGGNTSLASWRSMMAGVLKGPLADHLVGEYSHSLERRGVHPGSAETAQVVVARALADTDDLRRRVLEAPTGLTAAFSLRALLSSLHQNKIIQSITRRVQDIFGRRSVESDVRFTGRRRWRTSVVSSRHAHLNGVVRSEGEYFTVGGSDDWYGPRSFITNAAEASGCRCYLEFERTDGTWV